SDNPNGASVSIPVAPATPSDALVTQVTTNEIELQWTDNAGGTATQYTIMRKVGNGLFTNYVSLPPPLSAPPSTYTWEDTGVTPGTDYEYQIRAVNISGYNDFVGAKATTITLPPGGLRAAPGNGVVNLSWAAPTGALACRLYRGTA